MAKLKHWAQATRPKTLAASIAPVLLGGAMALADGHFRWHLVLVALICAVLIQIITNYINEIYDYKKGADTRDRIGPQRIVAAGIVTPRQMRNVAAVLVLITFLLGLILVAEGGWPILLAGVLALLFAWAYTGGPYPLAYLGVADIFVLIFFGLVAVCGTYYVTAGHLTREVIIAAMAPGLLSMNVLGVANIRDIETDRAAGKITLAVRLGPRWSRQLYTALTLLAFTVNGLLYGLSKDPWMLLPLAALGYAYRINRNLYRAQGRELIATLAATGKLLLLHSILMGVGFLL
ncbi:MAG: 1,4-dihydroxy-2-naphthoate polyprenyltransferase [Desulfobacterales bacterium]